MSDVFIFVAWLAIPALFVFFLMYGHAWLIDWWEPELIGPPRQAGSFSQFLYAKRGLWRAFVLVTLLCASSIGLAIWASLMFGRSLAPAGGVIYVLAFATGGLWAGAFERSKSFRSPLLRIASAGYAALTMLLLTLPELLQTCSAHAGCWYEPFANFG